MIVRKEELYDQARLRVLNENAFGRSDEARLVDALRASRKVLLSLVAEEEDGSLAGHALFTRVRPASGTLKVAGLGPLAVLPEHQGRGIGSELIRTGLEACRKAGYDAVVTLGEPGFYGKLGFEAAAQRGFTCGYDVPEDAFMIVMLAGGDLKGSSGKLSYEPEFDAFVREA